MLRLAHFGVIILIVSVGALAPSLPPASVALNFDTSVTTNSGFASSLVRTRSTVALTPASDAYQGSGAAVLDGLRSAIQFETGSFAETWTFALWIKYAPNITPSSPRRGYLFSGRAYSDCSGCSSGSCTYMIIDDDQLVRIRAGTEASFSWPTKPGVWEHWAIASDNIAGVTRVCRDGYLMK